MVSEASAQPRKLPDARRSIASDRASSQASSLIGRFASPALRRYIEPLMWVARDALPRWPVHVAIIVLCNIFGLAATLGAVGGVMAYARAAEQRRPMRILGHDLMIAGDLRSLLMLGGGIALLGVISALCMFWADRFILLLARRYHQLCGERVLRIAASPLSRGWQIIDAQPPKLILLRMTGSASRAMALTLRDMLRIGLPCLALFATAGFLFYIDVTLTAILLPVGMAYAVPLYLINRRVTRMQKLYRSRSPRARAELSQQLKHALASGNMSSLTSDSEAGNAVPMSSDAYQDAMSGLYGRLLADRRVQLLNAAFFVLCLVAVLIYFGLRTAHAEQPWSDFVFYLLALRYGSVALRQTSALAAKFSRFLPEFRAYSHFVESSSREAKRRAAAAPIHVSQLALRLGRHARWDSPRVLRITAGHACVVLAPDVDGFADLEAVLLRIENQLQDQADITTHADISLTGDWQRKKFGDQPAVVVMPASAIGTSENQQTVEGKVSPLMVIVAERMAELMSLPQHVTSAATFLVLDDHRLVAGGDWAWLESHKEAIASHFQALKRRSTDGTRASISRLADEDDEIE